MLPVVRPDKTGADPEVARWSAGNEAPGGQTVDTVHESGETKRCDRDPHEGPVAV